MCAVEHAGVQPDLIAVAKGVASGLPLGVALAKATIMEAWPPAAHASTFGGNPVACAAALETLKLLKGGLMANAADVGGYMMTALAALADKHPLIGDVRGRGLMIGVELVRDRQTKQRAGRDPIGRRGLHNDGFGAVGGQASADRRRARPRPDDRRRASPRSANQRACRPG